MHLRTDTSAQSHFSRVPTISHSRNQFTIAKRHLTTIQFDYLYPLYYKFIYPGDTLNVTMKALSRLTTQVAVLYDDLYIDAHAWFVPMRLIQTNWARFQFNAQPSGPSQDNSSLTTPYLTLGGSFAFKGLYDYLGYPMIAMTGMTHHLNNYLGRSYNLIWNENYRDQNLQNPAVVDLDEGPDTIADYTLLKRGKRHDKFTSCLTAQQKGTAAVLPLGSTAPIESNGTGMQFSSTATAQSIYTSLHFSSGDFVAGNPGAGSMPNAVTYYKDGLRANLSSATAATVNQLRTSIAVQHLLEADARGGTRDVESIQHRWGVTVPDFRLQRPEYCGGTTWTFDGHIVPQTSESGTTPQGTLTQFSQSLAAFNVNHSFVEHGIFMILVSCRSNITYQQGLKREISYRTRYDFYQPEFANLGEVAVLNKEIMIQPAAQSTNDATFGYQEYAYELRYDENQVSSEMRSSYTTPRDNKHLADEYATLPTLGSAWIQSDTAISRNITVAAATADPIEMNTLVTGVIARTLPMYSIPGLTRL